MSPKSTAWTRGSWRLCLVFFKASWNCKPYGKLCAIYRDHTMCVVIITLWALLLETRLRKGGFTILLVIFILFCITKHALHPPTLASTNMGLVPKPRLVKALTPRFGILLSRILGNFSLSAFACTVLIVSLS